MASKRPPPQVNINLLETKNLPKKSQTWDDNLLPIDFLLLTVKDCEFLSCLSHLNPGFYKSYRANLGYVYFGDIGDDEELNLKIALMKCNEGAGVGGATVVVKNAVAVLRPKAVFSVGYCGSLNGEIAKLGDVILSAKLTTYAPTKVTENGIEERGHSVPPNKHLAKLIKHAGEGWEKPLTDPSEELDVQVHRDGVFLSGPEKVESRTRCAQLIQRFPGAIAIEMEGEGLFAAAHDLGIEWIIIKAISEYADGNNSETKSWRRFASVMAASLTANILSDTIVFQSWPHYEGSSAKEQASAVKQEGTSACSSTSSSERKNLASTGSSAKEQASAVKQEGTSACSSTSSSERKNLASTGTPAQGVKREQEPPFTSSSVKRRKLATSGSSAKKQASAVRQTRTSACSSTSSCERNNLASTVVRPGYHPETDQVYKMTASPRGVALIINNERFDRNLEKSHTTRSGSEHDVLDIQELFKALGFEVQTKQNLTRQQLLNELDSVACQNHSEYDCFVLWLMSHGDEGAVYCTDGEKVLIETARDMFSNAACTSLKSKPKLFFVQSCRGGREDEGVVADKPSLIPQKVHQPNAELKPTASRIPEQADFLIANATVDGYVSYRNEVHGSLFVRNLVEVFYERAAHDHLVDILTKVNKRVSEKQGRSNIEGSVKVVKQMCEYTCRLTKELYF